MSNSIWFGTLIKEEVLGIDLKPLIDYVYQKKNELPNSKSGSHVDAWQSPNLQDNPIFQPLMDKIFENADDMVDICKVRRDMNLVISNLWANVNPLGGSNKPHNHPGAIFSGVFYLQCPDKSGDIHFTHPAVNQNYHFNEYTITEYNNVNAGTKSITPKPGMLLIFPGYQNHYVGANISDKDRIVIGFNMILTDINRKTNT